MLSNVKVGDKIWSVRHGWVEVTCVLDKCNDQYPIRFRKPEGGTGTCTPHGHYYVDDKYPTFFLTEMKLVPVKKVIMYRVLTQVNDSFLTTRDYYKSLEEFTRSNKNSGKGIYLIPESAKEFEV